MMLVFVLIDKWAGFNNIIGVYPTFKEAQQKVEEIWGLWAMDIGEYEQCMWDCTTFKTIVGGYSVCKIDDYWLETEKAMA